ncbi:hypothetical protein WJX75_005465 [Coccomyxa subellipsoidea]|uniref:UDENN domain-containing protein n=1 Tax=Coccomyxa subellipsoidea TaxID=248742 RepID=A0ABR2YUF2_9CHLO
MAPEEYSFTLTGGDGSRLHGFCRSFLPPRARLNSLRYPQVLCIITEHLWLTFYFKVLQVLEALLKQTDLLNGPAHASLPYASPASQFLENLSITCTGKLCPGEVLRLPLPRTPTPVNISPPRRIGPDFQSASQPPLRSTEQWLELEVPPDVGNGSENAGLPLARLLWHLSPPALVGLIEALMLERRVLMVAQERDTVSAAVHAAAALLHPLRWQHIYLPLLPLALKDYLSAPMPFLMGIHAPNLFMSTLRSSAMEELEAALALLHQTLRSPIEYESTPVIAALMQEYMVKLLGRYTEFVKRDLPGSPAPVPEANGTGPRIRHQDDGYIRAHGYRFNHAAFVASFSSTKARAFLEQLRQSQCYEVFFNERLRLASEGVPFGDPFEVAAAAMKRGKISKSIANAGAKGVSRVNAIIQKTSKAVKNIRHGNTEQAAAQNDRYQRTRPVRPMTPPVVTIPANHQFLSDDETSSSGSDSEATAAADFRRTEAQACMQMRPGPLPVQSASVQSASTGPGPPLRAHIAPPGNPPSGNGASVAASYYMPVVDRPSLLDMATEVSAGRAFEGARTPSLLDMDWALPGSGVDMHRTDRSAVQPTPSQQAEFASSKADDERPRNGWAIIGEVLGASLTGEPTPPQPHASTQLNLGPETSAAPVRASASLPVRSADPLAALDPFGDMASWASPDSSASPGLGVQSRTASQALHGSPLRASPNAKELPLQPLACSFSHSPATSTSVANSGMPYRLHDSLSSLAALSVAGSSPNQSPMNPGKALFEVQVNGTQQASAEQPGSGSPRLSNGPSPMAIPLANEAVFASADPQPLATSSAHSADSPQYGAGAGGVLSWVDLSTAQASPKIRHTESWTEWTAGAQSMEPQRTGSLQQSPMVSLLDL